MDYSYFFLKKGDKLKRREREPTARILGTVGHGTVLQTTFHLFACVYRLKTPSCGPSRFFHRLGPTITHPLPLNFTSLTFP